jgi:sporulation protein YlmC with PRC-barrel domain
MLKRIRLLGTAAVLAGVPLLSATAQTQSPAPAPPSASPPMTTQPATPMPQPATKPADRAEKPALNSPGDKSATAPAVVNSLVGLAVTSSEGTKFGKVQSVTTRDGKVTAIHIKAGGMLGLGGKLVAIPQGKFTRTGDNVLLGMTADEVSKLPELKISG